MEKIDEYLCLLPDWQQANLGLFRTLIHEVEPAIVEDFKWRVPVFLLNGKLYFAMSAFKAHTKYNFISNGAKMADPKKLFNNGFDSKKSRAIDLYEDDAINASELKRLIKASVATTAD